MNLFQKKLATSFRECNIFGELEDPKVDIKLFNAIGSIPEFLKSLIDNEPSLFDRLSPINQPVKNGVHKLVNLH